MEYTIKTCIRFAILVCPLVMATSCWGSEGQMDKRTEASDETPEERAVLVVDVSQAVHSTTARYLSLTISGGRLRNGLVGFDFSSPRLRSMAGELSPANIRFGGTEADFLHFDPKNKPQEDDGDLAKRELRSKKIDKRNIKRVTNFTMPGAQWDNLTAFCEEADWDIMWDFNLFFWKKGRWDPAHAKKFLKYSASKGIKIPAFQLGNEPNLYEPKFDLVIDGALLVDNFRRLKDLISEFPLYKDSGLYGPDTSNLQLANSARKYLASFLENGGCDLVEEVALHHYYLRGQEAKLKDFLDPEVMDNLQTHLDYAYAIILQYCTVPKTLCLSETSSASGGGLVGVSDAFAAGFLWLDKLGLSAKNKVTRVFRQTFFDSNYALITRKMEPNPDYFLSVLYKRLIEGPVFNVDTSKVSTRLRLYAHCARKGHYRYPDGALVIYYLNTDDIPRRLALGEYKENEVKVFVLTPGDGDLRSKEMLLNGEPLTMVDNVIPSMEPKTHKGAVPLPPESYGFIVIPDADVRLCRIYHRNLRQSQSVE